MNSKYGIFLTIRHTRS